MPNFVQNDDDDANDDVDEVDETLNEMDDKFVHCPNQEILQLIH